MSDENPFADVKLPPLDKPLIYFDFAEANANLLKCYGRLAEDDVKSMTKA